MVPSGEGDTGQVTRLLQDLGAGDRGAFDRLLPLVYDELRAIAGRQLGKEAVGHTLHPTALVHEAYVRLLNLPAEGFADRQHFLAVAARAMRRDWERTTLRDEAVGFEVALEDLIALDSALRRLADLDERLARVVEQRFFAGLSEPEIAEMLGVTVRTVQRDWTKARAWLHKELYASEP